MCSLWQVAEPLEPAAALFLPEIEKVRNLLVHPPRTITSRAALIQQLAKELPNICTLKLPRDQSIASVEKKPFLPFKSNNSLTSQSSTNTATTPVNDLHNEPQPFIPEPGRRSTIPNLFTRLRKQIRVNTISSPADEDEKTAAGKSAQF